MSGVGVCQGGPATTVRSRALVASWGMRRLLVFMTAAAPPTVGTSKRPGGERPGGRGGKGKGGKGEGGRRGKGERGGVLPKRLRFESGHHRLEACGPSNGRHKLA